MTRLIALLASFAVNFLLLGALEFSVYQASLPPDGVVSVVQLPSDADIATYAGVVAPAAR